MNIQAYSSNLQYSPIMYRSNVTVAHTPATRNTSSPTLNLGELLTALTESANSGISFLDILLWFMSVFSNGWAICILISRWAPVSEVVAKVASTKDTNEKSSLFENRDESATSSVPVDRCYTSWISIELATIFAHILGTSLPQGLAKPRIIPDGRRKAISLILFTGFLTFFELVQIARPIFWILGVFLSVGDLLDKLIHEYLIVAIVSMIVSFSFVMLFYATLILYAIVVIDLTSSLLDVLQISHPRRRHTMHPSNDRKKVSNVSCEYCDSLVSYDSMGCIEPCSGLKQSIDSTICEKFYCPLYHDIPFYHRFTPKLNHQAPSTISKLSPSTTKPAHSPSRKYRTLQILAKRKAEAPQIEQEHPRLSPKRVATLTSTGLKPSMR